ncbi:MAG: HU family DNA-binding protein [Holosporales bacterium]|jgi:integration host factor subunit alpha|nr:HU family DNA-binding protein [Holosporales bacterium]
MAKISRRDKTVVRVRLAEVLAQEFDIYRFQAEDFIETVLEEIGRALSEGKEVKISNFGAFRTVQRKSRMGRNPKTRESAEIKARCAVSFRPSVRQKHRMNAR